MKRILLAMLVIAGLAPLIPSGSSATPIGGPAIGAATQATMLDRVHCVPGWPHHRRGWDGCVRPRVLPVCRSVRVCGPRGCFWQRRCF